ncbi:MAG: type II toxin-antitoxin system VapC family toxin [Actinomycetota bacterium]|nr:type II toxin-antitoxin system VapC family toxin [Actinomycetota bacterium]
MTDGDVMPERPYLDSSVFIAWIKGEKVTKKDGTEEDRGEIATRILEDAEKGRFQVFCSTYVAVEVLKDKDRPKLSDDEMGKIDSYLQHEFIIWIELDLSLALHARDLARKIGLKPADAVHLASAIRGECDYLFRWDDKWVGGKYDGVEVCDPFWMGQPTMPGMSA